jgi:hypothetical protein
MILFRTGANAVFVGLKQSDYYKKVCDIAEIRDGTPIRTLSYQRNCK